MADTQDTQSPRPTNAQSVRESHNYDHQPSETTEIGTSANRRDAFTYLRRTKEAARCQEQEAVVARYSDSSFAGMRTVVRDHRGKVA